MNKKSNTSSSSTEPIIFSLLVICLVLILGSSHLYIANKKLSKDIKNYQSNESQQTNDDTEYLTQDDFTEYFVSNILSRYPKFNQEITHTQITKTISFLLKDKTSAWIVEVKNDENKLSHYLFSDTVQKKLANSMVSQSGETGTCELSDILSIGSYLVLPSTNCIAYGSGNTIAVYSLDTGDQIKLTGQNFTKSGTTWGALSDKGNTFGDLIGIYGLTQPKLMVKYGNQDTPAVIFAYFDLKTGKLFKKETFN
jgi:hypothetical protein